LFFNATEQQQIDRLASLLSTDNLPSVQQRLEEQGMRKGFACLFYGGPGTGKTETVLQIARQTGRDLMQVDIAGLRDKWVGESEKNIKEVFARYRDLCKNSEVMPILFFNEADAIINKRTENVEHSVDKMDNAMQNIILQEIEDLDGILIATTNLTCNLDKAFERRFLYKIEFHKPDTEVKTKIWRTMVKDLTFDDAHKLASSFDFSGGQIENIARKRIVDYILSGKSASIDEIVSYCQAELLANKQERKHIAGFVL
jgi:SpoVK/Ycf46/Vps4 family AAA+-type ATPase